MGLSAIGSGAGREQDVSVSAGANSETVDSAPLASPKRLIGALGNLGRAARAAFPATGARRPQFACASSSGDDKLPAQGFFPGIGDEQIRKTEEEGGEVQAHQLAVLPEEQNSRLNREARGEPAAQAARWLAPDVPQVDGRAAMGAAYISLRGRDEPAGPQPSIPAVSYGDRDSFGSAINGSADKQAQAYEKALQGGARPNEAQEQAKKATGRSNPDANFSADTTLTSGARSQSRRLSGLHSLTAALGLSGTSIGASSDTKNAAPNIDPQADFPAGGQPAVERMRPSGVAQRGVDETHSGDGSIYDKVIDEVAGKFADVYNASSQGGAGPDEAQAAGDKAVGRIDPQANFSVRRPLLSSLAAAFRLNREQAPDAGHRPRPMLRPRLA